MTIRIIFFSLFLLVLGFIGQTRAEPLPEGNSGISMRYPGDVGIGADSDVIFADDFESYSTAAGLTSKWNESYQSANTRISTEQGNSFSGTKALEYTLPKQSAEVSNSTVKYVNPGQDLLFLRYYAKYDGAFNVLGSSHNGSGMSAKYCCPGVSADGYNKFAVLFEAWREENSVANPGKLNVYVYHPDQRDAWGDHFFPTGVVLPLSYILGDFGPQFVARPDVVPQLGRWYSYEYMVKANTPGQRDGRIAMWLDGKLIADFPNIRLRETTALKIDRFTIDLHVKNNTLAVAKKWYDNVVAAKSYIGPMVSNQTFNAPTNLRVLP